MNAIQTDTIMKEKIIMQTKEIISSTVHKTVHLLSCYVNIPKYSKLFIQIIRETSVRENDCPGNVLYGNHLVRESSCPGKVLSGKRPVRETSCPGNVCLGKWLSGKCPLPCLLWPNGRPCQLYFWALVKKLTFGISPNRACNTSGGVLRLLSFRISRLTAGRYGLHSSLTGMRHKTKLRLLKPIWCRSLALRIRSDGNWFGFFVELCSWSEIKIATRAELDVSGGTLATHFTDSSFHKICRTDK